MELLAASALIIAVVYGLVRWAAARRVRFVPLIVGAGCGTAFMLAFLHYDLQDSDFLEALAVACGAAIVLSAAGGLIGRQGLRRSLLYGAIAATLVVSAVFAYIPVSLMVCWLTGCHMN